MVKIGFIGCHEISLYCLKRICELSKDRGDNVSIVYNLTKEEGKKHSAYVDFDSLQKQFGFELHYVSNVSSEHSIELLKKSDLDVLFIIGWHRIVPQTVLDSAKVKLGIHSSMLPKDRGSSPINWQIIRDEKEGGITLFHLTDEVDSGAIVDQYRYEISAEDDIGTVYQKATKGSIILLERNWEDICQLNPKAIEQNEGQVTINLRRKPEDGLIKWSRSSVECYNWIRALTKPYPGAFTFWNKKKVFLWTSKMVVHKSGKYGEIIDNEKLIVSTGEGCLEILSVQIEEEPICSGEVFVKSNNICKGAIFDDNA